MITNRASKATAFNVAFNITTPVSYTYMDNSGWIPIELANYNFTTYVIVNGVTRITDSKTTDSHGSTHYELLLSPSDTVVVRFYEHAINNHGMLVQFGGSVRYGDTFARANRYDVGVGSNGMNSNERSTYAAYASGTDYSDRVHTATKVAGGYSNCLRDVMNNNAPKAYTLYVDVPITITGAKTYRIYKANDQYWIE